MQAIFLFTLSHIESLVNYKTYQTPIANKLKWDSEKIDILAQIISNQVKRNNYDEGALIKSFQKALSQFGL